MEPSPARKLQPLQQRVREAAPSGCNLHTVQAKLLTLRLAVSTTCADKQLSRLYNCCLAFLGFSGQGLSPHGQRGGRKRGGMQDLRPGKVPPLGAPGAKVSPCQACCSPTGPEGGASCSPAACVLPPSSSRILCQPCNPGALGGQGTHCFSAEGGDPLALGSRPCFLPGVTVTPNSMGVTSLH